jgi:uncharacterized protein YggE
MTSRLLLTAAAVTLNLPFALAQQSQGPPIISVSGSAEVKVAPDEIYLQLGVETRHANLEEAKKQNDERVNKAISFLKASNIKSKDIQTDFISIEPTYDSDISLVKPVAFIVRKSIEVKLAETKTFEAILSGLLTNGVTNVHGIEFRTSQLRKHRDTARAMAIRAAIEKADALAAELGVKRGRVHNVNANEWGGWFSSSGGYWGRGYGGAMMQNAVQEAGPSDESDANGLSVGQISISATVNVSFVIE